MTVHEILPALPDVPALRDRCRAPAMLEAVMDATGFGFFGYAGCWSETEEVALMDNGSGDDCAIVFSPAGACARGFAHESRMSPYGDEDRAVWHGLVDAVPPAFRRYVTEPAFCDEGVPRATVVFWRETADGSWRTGPVEFPTDDPDGYADGAEDLFGVLAAGTPEAYRDFAEDCYEPERPLTEAVLTALNPEADPAGAARAATRIGYPVAG
ncbi:hypothetical protein [Streptomyces sp. NBC_01233]|uniref:hypothetical protein n=1 Tax=Streptomyces sp. NBC_01233 TaxID=2903787 RepID=UPI002E10CA5D|nr:hypothetical protein OG332_19785 [Streptomyces sp. NBC_01233]